MASSSDSETEDVVSSHHPNNNNDDEDEESELERIQEQCFIMVNVLKKLEREEHDLQCQLEILAREALLCGFSPETVEAPPPKRRRTAGAKKKTEDS